VGWSHVDRFSEAGAARTQSAQAAARANTEQAVDVGLFTDYAAALSAGDERLAGFIEERFRDEFRPAFEAWRALDPLNNPDAPATPFEMDFLLTRAVADASPQDLIVYWRPGWVTWVNVMADPDGARHVRLFHGGDLITPTAVTGAGRQVSATPESVTARVKRRGPA
jgi:hypothetical protein